MFCLHFALFFHFLSVPPRSKAANLCRGTQLQSKRPQHSKDWQCSSKDSVQLWTESWIVSIPKKSTSEQQCRCERCGWWSWWDGSELYCCALAALLHQLGPLPNRREQGCLFYPKRPWETFSNWASNGSIGGRTTRSPDRRTGERAIVAPQMAHARKRMIVM